MFLIFVRNLRYHQLIDAKVLKGTSGIGVKQALLINEKKAVLAIMDEVKNMLDDKVGHYIKYEDIPLTYQKLYSANLCSLNKNSFLMEIWIN